MMTINFRSFLYACAIVLTVSACSQKKKDALAEQKAEIALRYDIPPPKAISESEKQKLYTRIKHFYDTVLVPSAFNGGIIVAKGGNIIFEQYRGSVNMDDADSINAFTPMHIASITKTFTSMAVLKLQEEGKLNIQDTLNRFFPSFNYPGVTIKNLLSNRSGLPNYVYFMEKAGWNPDSVITNENMLDWLINKKGEIKDIIPPDRKFTYCNTNFALLALIIEKVSGMSYPAYMKKYIFDPMGLKNTFVHHLRDSHVRAKSFDWKGREIPDNFLDHVYGDKNIYSTPQDLLRWDRALTDTSFLSAASLASAYMPYSNEKPGIKNYGFGWRMNLYDNGKKIIFHTGWWHGNNAIFIRLLDTDATIIVMSNRYTRAVYQAKYLANLFDHYFDADVADPDTIVPETLPEVFPALTKEEIRDAKKMKKGLSTAADSVKSKSNKVKMKMEI